MADPTPEATKVGEVYVIEGAEVHVDLRSPIDPEVQLEQHAHALHRAAQAQLQAAAAANVPGYQQQINADGTRDGAVDATPAAEEAAAQHDVDLADVEGTGKDGRVTKPDVEAAVEE
jgi:pyruvate/2-oxoglutarate dehydrogenase complex dihydrolipoamide acyltransferase (E2) component